jgi:hydrogenase nickel incorporation protein HypA/HybF
VHEYSIVQALIARVEEEARARHAASIERLTVRIGELSGVETGLLASAWEVFRERTLCAGAELEVRPVAARWSCPRCGAAPRSGAALRCPDCELPMRLAEGGEIVLDRIEMEVADV